MIMIATLLLEIYTNFGAFKMSLLWFILMHLIKPKRLSKQIVSTNISV